MWDIQWHSSYHSSCYVLCVFLSVCLSLYTAFVVFALVCLSHVSVLCCLLSALKPTDQWDPRVSNPETFWGGFDYAKLTFFKKTIDLTQHKIFDFSLYFHLHLVYINKGSSSIHKYIFYQERLHFISFRNACLAWMMMSIVILWYSRFPQESCMEIPKLTLEICLCVFLC